MVNSWLVSDDATPPPKREWISRYSSYCTITKTLSYFLLYPTDWIIDVRCLAAARSVSCKDSHLMFQKMHTTIKPVIYKRCKQSHTWFTHLVYFYQPSPYEWKAAHAFYLLQGKNADSALINTSLHNGCARAAVAIAMMGKEHGFYGSWQTVINTGSYISSRQHLRASHPTKSAAQRQTATRLPWKWAEVTSCTVLTRGAWYLECVLIATTR